MINCCIRLYQMHDEELGIAVLGRIIDERPLAFGEVAKMVLNMFHMRGNVGTTIQQLAGHELALSHEYYIGPKPPQYEQLIPDSWYAFWYTFEPPKEADTGDLIEFAFLCDLFGVYAQIADGSSCLRRSPEVEQKLPNYR